MSSRLQYGRWAALPGSFDVCRCLQVFPSSNKFGIPDIEPFYGDVPDFFIPWNQRVRSGASVSRSARHFFLDDYRFECLWGSPDRYWAKVRECGCVLSPDFSLWVDQPMATQVWNVFRNRWMGCFWQRGGAGVIPTVSWAGEGSFEFCFDGVASGSVVAVSTVGCVRDGEARMGFVSGYREMVRRLDPRLILVYGKMIDEVAGLAEVRMYPTRWDGRKKRSLYSGVDAR